MSRLAGASPPTANLRGLDADKWQRGHVGPPVAVAWWQPDIATYSLPAGWRRSVRTARLRYAQRLGGTSPVLRKCNFVRCGAAMASARWRIVLDQPSPAARPGRCVRGSCGTRPLRQSYITPHCSQCPPVSRKLLLWQPPLRALRVKATGVMQNCLRWAPVAQPSALPGQFLPYAPPSARPCGWCGTVASVRRFAQGVCSVACGQSCCVCPARPVASPLRGIGPGAGLPVRPQGAPSAQRQRIRLCVTDLVVGNTSE